MSRYLPHLAFLLLGTLVAAPAHAYLDPASGSLILQLILGGLAGLAMAVKLYWRRIQSFFGPDKERDEDTN